MEVDAQRLAGAVPAAYEPHEDGEALKPQMVLEHLRDSVPEDTILCSGVGQHQMWASQYWKFRHPYTWINSGGLGTMGFSVPAAIGAKVGRPDRMVWAVDGDGCFQMTAQELVTATAERIPVKVAILNNAYLGMVRQWQEMFYDERYSEVYLSPDLPDYVKWAEAMGCVGLRAESPEEIQPVIDKANEIDDRPVVVEFRTDGREKVFPMVAGRQDERRDPGPVVPAQGEGADMAESPTSVVRRERPAPPHAVGAGREQGRRARPRRRTCSPAGATTSSRWRSPRPTTSASAASRSWSTSSRRRSSRSSSSSTSWSTSSTSASSTRARRWSASCCWPPSRPARPTAAQVVELARIFEGRILAVNQSRLTLSLEGHPSKVDDFEELLADFGIVELQRTGRVALPKLEREARRLHSVPLDVMNTPIPTQRSA